MDGEWGGVKGEWARQVRKELPAGPGGQGGLWPWMTQRWRVEFGREAHLTDSLKPEVSPGAALPPIRAP